MNLEKLSLTCSAMALFGAVSVNAQAAAIWLQPDTNVEINPSGSATYNLWADAADVGGFLGGGLDLFYNSTVLTYNDDFAFDASFPNDPALSRTGDNCSAVLAAGCSGPGEINGIAFGNFSGLAAGGPTLVGSLSFSGLGEGVSPLTMADNDSPAGSWFATDGSGPLVVEYGSGQVTVEPLATLDFGDAPDASYPTLLTSDGARHVVIPRTGPTLGSLIDAELDGQPDVNATGDDNAGLNDEDGISLGILTAGELTDITVTVTALTGVTSFLNAWVDFNLDGDWGDIGEQIFADVAVSAGSTNLSFMTPIDALVGTSYARFRLSSLQGLSFTGLAPDGEVEDYQIRIEEAQAPAPATLALMALGLAGIGYQRRKQQTQAA